MDIKVTVPATRKCAASIDWNREFTKATLSFGDKETPDTDVEIEFGHLQLEELGCLVLDAQKAGQEGKDRIKAEKANKPYHDGAC